MSNNIIGKKKARQLAVQSLYQWHVAKDSISEIEAQFRAIKNMARVDLEYYQRIIHGVTGNIETIEAKMQPFLDREIESLNPVELAILWISTYELLNCLEVPYKVILDEAIGLAREFGSQDGHKYVNGVLHSLAKDIRIHED